MASDRAQGLVYLSESGMDAVLAKVNRLATDSAEGYKWVLDAALRRVGVTSADLGGTDVVPDDKEEMFLALLIALTYDMVMPQFAMLVDQQVDQPLTMVKASQAYMNLAKERNLAWTNCAQTGYGPGSLYLGRFTTDWQEPSLCGGFADFYGCRF